MKYQTIEDVVGKTPLVALQRIGAQDNAARGNVILCTPEGNTPARSVKDRPGLAKIRDAEERGGIKPPHPPHGTLGELDDGGISHR